MDHIHLTFLSRGHTSGVSHLQLRLVVARSGPTRRRIEHAIQRVPRCDRRSPSEPVRRLTELLASGPLTRRRKTHKVSLFFSHTFYACDNEQEIWDTQN